MDSDLKTLREVSIPWNEYQTEKTNSSNTNMVGIGLILAGLMLSSNILLDPLQSPSNFYYLLVPLIGVVITIFGYFQDSKARKLKRLVDELGADKVQMLENALLDFDGVSPDKSEDIFDFYREEGSNRHRKVTYWVAKPYPNYVKVLKTTSKEIYFPDKEDFLIEKGQRLLLSKDYSAYVRIGSLTHNVNISEKSYEKYAKLMKPPVDESSEVIYSPDIDDRD